MNLALHGKWWWRFHIKKDALWNKAIASEKYLEEKHVTWARFGKKVDKNATFQAPDFHYDAFTKSAHKVKFLIKVVTSQCMETASEITPDANVNPSSPPTCEPSCLEGEPRFEIVVGSEEFVEEIEEKFEEEEEEDDLEYFNCDN
ncbi:hypothetical protein Tco_0746795 [Tanacetum coccineum]